VRCIETAWIGARADFESPQICLKSRTWKYLGAWTLAKGCLALVTDSNSIPEATDWHFCCRAFDMNSTQNSAMSSAACTPVHPDYCAQSLDVVSLRQFGEALQQTTHLLHSLNPFSLPHSSESTPIHWTQIYVCCLLLAPKVLGRKIELEWLGDQTNFFALDSDRVRCLVPAVVLKRVRKCLLTVKILHLSLWVNPLFLKLLLIFFFNLLC